MAYCKDPFGMNRRANRTLNSMFKVGTSVAKAVAREAKAQQRAYERQQAAYQRYLIQEERSRVRAMKAQEVAERRAEREREAAIRREERERAKAERERQKAAILKAKNDELQRIEAEMEAIDEENELWTNIHQYSDKIITKDDVDKAIADCVSQRADIKSNGLFSLEYPSKARFLALAEVEGETRFHIDTLEASLKEAQKNFSNTAASYNIILAEEPTRGTVVAELVEQATREVKSFWPWKQKRLRQEFVDKRSDIFYLERHSTWQRRMDEYKQILNTASDELAEVKRRLAEEKKLRDTFVNSRSEELFRDEVSKWTQERDQFFDTYLLTMNNLLDGNKEFILSAINAAFASDDEELPMEYYLEVTYDEGNGRVKVNLDLPEIEDVPLNKVVVNPSGNRSIRSKTQTNLKEDYAKSVCGLSLYVASIIFNTCLKIKEVEVSGFTQRCGDNTALATDQYILLCQFTREVFEQIDYNRFTSLEVMDFFKHHIDLTKSFVLKEINLDKARERMETFIPAIYGDYIAKPNKINVISDETA